MWFTENAWQPMLLFAILGMLAGYAWYHRLQSRYMWMMVGCLAAAAITWFVERSIETHRERVTSSVVEITTAFQQQDLKRTLSYVSEGSPDLKALVSGVIWMISIENMRLTDTQVELTSGKTRAVSRFRINADFGFGNTTYREPTRWKARWQLEEGEWKMIDITQLDPLTGDVTFDFLHLRQVPNLLKAFRQ